MHDPSRPRHRPFPLQSSNMSHVFLQVFEYQSARHTVQLLPVKLPAHSGSPFPCNSCSQRTPAEYIRRARRTLDSRAQRHHAAAGIGAWQLPRVSPVPGTLSHSLTSSSRLRRASGFPLAGRAASSSTAAASAAQRALAPCRRRPCILACTHAVRACVCPSGSPYHPTRACVGWFFSPTFSQPDKPSQSLHPL